MGEDLTIHEAAADPLIGQVLKADGVPQGAFAQLLQSAARLRAIELEKAISVDENAPTVEISDRNRANKASRDNGQIG